MTSTTEAFAAALAAEYAAIFGYGVLGAHLDKAGQDVAHDVEAVHRGRRDQLLIRIAAASSSPPGAAAGYALPFPVVDRASALKLAVELEEGTARAWRAALSASTGDDRAMALDALVDCAVRATRWRRTAGVAPAVVVFPGA
jgi:hypothetical protein